MWTLEERIQGLNDQILFQAPEELPILNNQVSSPESSGAENENKESLKNQKRTASCEMYERN